LERCNFWREKKIRKTKKKKQEPCLLTRTCLPGKDGLGPKFQIVLKMTPSESTKEMDINFTGFCMALHGGAQKKHPKIRTLYKINPLTRKIQNKKHKSTEKLLAYNPATNLTTFSLFFTITACFGSKTCFLRWFHNRSVSFFGQETQERIKTIKKRCLEAENNIFS